MDKKHYPTAFLLVIAVALYFMYGERFSLNNVNFSAYKEVCLKYQTAKEGTYKDEELLSLISKVNYLLPEAVEEIPSRQQQRDELVNSVRLENTLHPEEPFYR